MMEHLLIKDILKVHYGKALKQEDRDESGNTPVFGSSGYVGNHTETLVDFPTIIIGRKGSVGAVTYAPNGGWPIDTAFYIEPIDKENLDLRYLYYALINAKLAQHTITTSIPGLNRNDIYRTRIPLPPLAEQKRIAAILDKADALRAKRRAALAKLDSLLQATFLDIFGDPVANPKGWTEGVVGDVVHAAQDGPHVSPEYADEGVPFLSTRHIRPGKVIWEDLKYISHEEAEVHWKKCKPAYGDILYTKGGTTGLAKAVDFNVDFAIWVHIALLKTNHEVVDSLWLEGMLNTSYCYAQSQRYTRGIANRDLGLNRMVKIKLYIPPIKKQHEYAMQTRKIRAHIQHMESHAKQLDCLFHSLQQRAFKGDL